jgi:2-polyprenyl-3-methyl-5-hydroxy-6-metoxy-1,4-benzoquinol methylase
MLDEFNEAYQEALEFMSTYSRDKGLQKEVAKLDLTMDTDKWDIEAYLQKSIIRYRNFFENESLIKRGGTWLEIGCLYPALPIALSIMGFKVTVAEEFNFYPESFINMFKRIEEKYKVEFKNVNFTTKENQQEISSNSFDHVSCMAVIEHLPYTPKVLLENIYNVVKSSGVFFLDTPNIFYWGKYRKYLLLKTINPEISRFYNSGIPFVGHHREYSQTELKYVVKASKFEIVNFKTYNYSISRKWEYLTKFPVLFSRFRETLFTVLKMEQK